MEYDAGALHATVVEGRVLLAGKYCSSNGFYRVDLRDAATGEVLDVACVGNKEWFHDPSQDFTVFTWRGGTYALYLVPRPRGYEVLRVTPKGFEHADSAFPDDPEDYVTEVTPVCLDGALSILTCSFRTAKFRMWLAGGHELRSWQVPGGWDHPRPLRASSHTYAWLSYDIPDTVPPADHWRAAAEHGRRLWDLTTDTPVGPPLPVRGYEWGPWALNGRPLMLFKVDWRDFQVWDLSRREALGPGLGDLDLSNPSIGLLHGRPALAATVGNCLCTWDIATARLLGTASLPDRGTATAIGPAGTAWAITRTGHVASLTITPAEIHPSANRTPRPSPRERRRVASPDWCG